MHEDAFIVFKKKILSREEICLALETEFDEFTVTSLSGKLPIPEASVFHHEGREESPFCRGAHEGRRREEEEKIRTYHNKGLLTSPSTTMPQLHHLLSDAYTALLYIHIILYMDCKLGYFMLQ
jgi:hypothetical protein